MYRLPKGLTPNRLRLLAMFGACLLLSSCGGGGSGSDTPPPPPGPGDTEMFFPDTVGDTWFYDGQTGSSAMPGQDEQYFHQVAVTGTKSFGSTLARVFTSTVSLDPAASVEDYHSKDADGVTYHGSNDVADTLAAAIVPYREANFPMTPGVITDLSRSNIDFGEDLDGDGRNERIDFTLRITLDGFEELTVPVGTFARTARRTSKIDGTLRATTGGSAAFTMTERLWCAPGVGLVMEDLTLSAGDESLQESLVARGYKVNGVARGMGVPYPFLSELVQGDSDTYMPGPHAMASDGSGFLLVTLRETAIGSSPRVTKIVAAFGDADGKVVREVDVTSPAPVSGARPYDVVFDGTHYLLVYAAGTVDGTPMPLNGTRISPSGTMIDGAAGFQIAAGRSGFAAVARGNSSSLVVYASYDNDVGLYRLYGRLITAGNVVGAEFPIGARDRQQLYPDVAFDGTNFLVTWEQLFPTVAPSGSTGIVAARVSEAGAVLGDPAGLVVSNTGKESYTPRVAFGGGRYLIAWQDTRNSDNYLDFDIYGARVSTDGVLLDGPATTGGLRITGEDSYYPRDVHVVHTGSAFLVTWAAGSFAGFADPSGIFGARIAADGTRIPATGYGINLSGRPPLDTSSTYEFPRVERVGTRLIVTWLDNSQAGGLAKGVAAVTVYSLD
jgi:hypothetical protein